MAVIQVPRLAPDIPYPSKMLQERMSLRQALVEQYKCQVKICWEMNENFGQYAMPKKCKYLKFVDENGFFK